MLSALLFELQPQVKYNIHDPIYHRLKARIFDKTPARFDIAFFGSSHIWNAVNTELINKRRPQIYTYNFGVNWFGNDAKLILIRDLLEQKPVGKLVLEITNEDDHAKHNYFRFLATMSDLEPALKDAWRNISWRDAVTLSPNFKEEAEHLAGTLVPFTTKGYYFTFREFLWHTPPVDPDDPAGFLSIDRTIEFDDPSIYIGQADDSHKDVRLSRSLRSISKLCQQHGVELYFLFVPSRNEPSPGNKFLALLSEHGRVIQLDAKTYYQPDLWYNRGHLNTKGANIFTELLLKSELFEKPASQTP